MRRMLRSPFLAALVACGLIAASPADAARTQKKKEEPKQEEKAPAEEEKAPADKPKKPEEKPFSEIIDGFEKVEGLFTFWRDDDEGKAYIEIKPEQFDTIYLASITRSAGDGWWFDSSAMLNEFPFVFTRVGKTVQWLHKNVYFRADPEAAIGRALDRGLSDSLMGVGKITGAPHPETGALLVDPSDMFVQDIAMVGYIFREFIKQPSYNFDKANSYFGAVKSFPQNTEIDVVLHFQSGNPQGGATLADSRAFRHIYHYSLSTLPSTGYKPRLADDRVGHFLTMYQDFTSQLQDTPYVRYVNRWQLDKAEPKFGQSKPRQPIVFWLENTIPVEHREAVRDGVLLWNDAFAKIGFKDAIEVRQMPDDADWDPADVRYNVVRWMVQPGAGYAVGPSRTNPFTGQIYDADIRVSADMLRFVYQEFEEFAQPSAIGDRIAAEQGVLRRDGRALCDFQEGLRRQAAFAWSVVAARSDMAAGGAALEEFLRQFIIEVIAHEVGHTLGFRHNFKASTIRSVDALGNGAQAHTGSVMDYNPVNVAPKGQPQGAYYQTVLGPYDYWVVEYAYKPMPPDSSQSEKAMLEQIASRAADPMLAYGTDEDAWFGPRGMDPTATRWDLGDDSMEYYRGRIGLAEELWASIEAKFEKQGEQYQKLRRVFNQGFGEYFGSVMNVAKYIGGVYHHRDHIGDPNGRLPYQPVPAARQRQALDFLTSEVLAPDAFRIPSSLMNKLAAERMWDFSGAIWETPRNDYPLHERIWRIQSMPLDHLYDPLLQQRMLDIELRDGADVLTLPEVFTGLRSAIWAELDAGSNITSLRRGLQRMHLDRLVATVVKPAPGTPEDACALARADLKALQAQIASAVAGGSLDAYTRAHLDETAAVIEAALEAGIERQLG